MRQMFKYHGVVGFPWRPAAEHLTFRSEDMLNPTSESTKLEGKGGFREYSGVGKLRGKKVLITGGE